MKLRNLLFVCSLPMQGHLPYPQIALAETMGLGIAEKFKVSTMCSALLTANHDDPVRTAEVIGRMTGLSHKGYDGLTCHGENFSVNDALQVIRRYEELVTDLIIVIEHPMDLVLPAAFGLRRMHQKNIRFPSEPLKSGQLLHVDTQAGACQLMDIDYLSTAVA